MEPTNPLANPALRDLLEAANQIAQTESEVDQAFALADQARTELLQGFAQLQTQQAAAVRAAEHNQTVAMLEIAGKQWQNPLSADSGTPNSSPTSLPNA